MDNLLEKIECDYKKICGTEYIFYLENGSVINLRFKIENLPHLIGIHKLSGDYVEIRQMTDKSDVHITPTNILSILKEKNINYESFKLASSWNEKLQLRMENLNFIVLDGLLRKTTIFNFLYDSPKTKNKKARYVLMDRPRELFVHLYLGIDKSENFYFPNSFVADQKKDANLSRSTTKIIKTEIYKLDIHGTNKVEIIEHEKIRSLTEELKKNVKLYSSKNHEVYSLARKEQEYMANLEEVNELSMQIKRDYQELIKFISAETFFNSKSNAKVKSFLEVANVL